MNAALAGAAQRWFSEGFRERQPHVSTALLHALRDTDPKSYAEVCDALAGFDVTDRLHEIATPSWRSPVATTFPHRRSVCSA